MLWGVAGGLAEHIGFSPTLVRAAFVLITFFGGAGLLAYLVLAVALPEDDGTGKPVDESVWARLGKVVLVCILVAIALGFAAGIAVVSAWITATGHGTVVAVIVIALGAALVATAFATDVRRRVTPPLLVLALVLGIPAGAIAAADIKFDNSVGQRTYTRRGGRHSRRWLQARHWPAGGRPPPAAVGPGQTIVASAHLGIGQLIVSAPSNVCVLGHVTGKAGELIDAGDVSHGVDPEIDKATPTSNAPRLDLNADIQLGQMVVTDRIPTGSAPRGGLRPSHQQEAAQRRVCGR